MKYVITMKHLQINNVYMVMSHGLCEDSQISELSKCKSDVLTFDNETDYNAELSRISGASINPFKD